MHATPSRRPRPLTAHSPVEHLHRGQDTIDDLLEEDGVHMKMNMASNCTISSAFILPQVPDIRPPVLDGPQEFGAKPVNSSEMTVETSAVVKVANL